MRELVVGIRFLYCDFDLVVFGSTCGVCSKSRVSLRVLEEWFEAEFAEPVSRMRTDSPEAVCCGFDVPIAAVGDYLAVVDGLLDYIYPAATAEIIVAVIHHKAVVTMVLSLTPTSDSNKKNECELARSRRRRNSFLT